MNIKVISTSSNQTTVKVNPKQKVKTTVASGIIMARTLEELLDVDVTGVKDKYVVMYNSATQKYTAVNPDDILSASVTDTDSPGLPSNFIDQLDVDLDNKIDIDAGTF